jgi:hypothetical protein
MARIKSGFTRQLFPILLLLLSNHAQAQDWIWAESYGGTGSQQSRGIGCDSLGYIYVSGGFEDTLHLDNSTFVSNGRHDIFLAKLDSNGNSQWITTVGGTGNDFALCSHTDQSGNTYLGGYVDSGTVMGTDTFPAATMICKYDAAGNLLWVSHSSLSTGSAYIYAITVDMQNNTYVTGYFQGMIVTGTDTVIAVPSGRNVYVKKLDPLGNLLWTRNFGSPSPGVNRTEGWGISVNGIGNVMVVGKSSGIISFDNINLPTTSGSDDLLIFVLDSVGDVVSARRHSTTNVAHGLAVHLEDDGTHYVGGGLSGTMDFGGTVLSTVGTFGGDLFMAKYAPNSALQWVHSSGAEQGGLIYAIAKSGDDVYFAGDYHGPFSLGGFQLNGFQGPFFAKLDTNGNFLDVNYGVCSLNSSSIRDIAATPTGDIVASGYFMQAMTLGSLFLPANTITQDCFVINYGTGGYKSKVHGKVFWDQNADCIEDTIDVRLESKIVHLQPSNNYYIADSLGEYRLHVDSGQYDISMVSNDPLRSVLCPSRTPHSFGVGRNDTLAIDFALKSDFLCPRLTINIATGQLRPCMASTYYIEYSNQGTTAEDSVYIEIIFDSFILPVSSTAPYSQVSSDTYRFWIDTLNPLEHGSFQVEVMVDCNAILGATQCAKAAIYPVYFCDPTALWDKSRIVVYKECVGDSLSCFTIKNLGEDMTVSSSYDVFIDNVLTSTANFMLNEADSVIVCQNSNGATISVLADQHQEYPGFEYDIEAIERCGLPPYSLGFIMQLPQADSDHFQETDCTEITGSFDPNDKRVTPVGLTSNHYVDSLVTLEYLINFQNTGTDTAFTVVIVDTLSSYLNPASIHSMLSTHNYQMEIMNGDELKFTFNNILLPDSNINEPQSHGFIKFKIDQQPGNPKGSVITNSADIYFDYNAPIKTNTTLNTIFDTILVSYVTPIPLSPNYSLELFPNPSTGIIHVAISRPATLTIVNSVGQITSVQQLNQTEETIDLTGYSKGIYFLQFDLGELGETRKIILN